MTSIVENDPIHVGSSSNFVVATPQLPCDAAFSQVVDTEHASSDAVLYDSHSSNAALRVLESKIP